MAFAYCVGSGGWINLPQGGLKLNVDAANDKDSLNTGFGFILFDSDGHLVAVMERNWKGFLHAKMAEAIEVREALKWLKTLGYDDVQLESNALLVIDGIKNHSFFFFNFF